MATSSGWKHPVGGCFKITEHYFKWRVASARHWLTVRLNLHPAGFIVTATSRFKFAFSVTAAKCVKRKTIVRRGLKAVQRTRLPAFFAAWYDARLP